MSVGPDLNHFNRVDEAPTLGLEACTLAWTFADENGWDGEFDDLDHLWLAPPGWHDPTGSPTDMLCKFVYEPRARRQQHAWTLSTLSRVEQAEAGLYWDRAYVERSIDWGKLELANKSAVHDLEQIGMVQSQAARTFYVPIAADLGVLSTAMSRAAIDDALAPFAQALRLARDAATALRPFVDELWKKRWASNSANRG